jgi:hypothetical protein
MKEATQFVRKPLSEVSAHEPFTLPSNLEDRKSVVEWVWFRLADDEPTVTPVLQAWTGSKWSDFCTLEIDWADSVIVLEVQS